MNQSLKKGSLLVVGTPIGNLEDITLRALKVLKNADFVLCEDTRKTQRILNNYDIKVKLKSFHSYSGQGKIHKILSDIEGGKNAAIVSEAGTPCISDPGSNLIRDARERDISIVSIPGPSALTSALSISGAPADRVLFVGFLKRKDGKRKKAIEEIKALNVTAVLYESKNRIESTLEILKNIMPDNKVLVAREMTKTFEETILGKPDFLLNELREKNKLKGEFTVVIYPLEEKPNICESEILKEAKILLKKMSPKETAANLASVYGYPKKKIYNLIVNERKKSKE